MFAMAICYNGNQKGEAYETSFSWLSGHIKVVEFKGHLSSKASFLLSQW
jgi:hypothetical protein